MGGGSIKKGKEEDDAWDPCVSVWRGKVEGVRGIWRVKNGESVGVNNLIWREIFLGNQIES